MENFTHMFIAEIEEQSEESLICSVVYLTEYLVAKKVVEVVEDMVLHRKSLLQVMGLQQNHHQVMDHRKVRKSHHMDVRSNVNLSLAMVLQVPSLDHHNLDHPVQDLLHQDPFPHHLLDQDLKDLKLLFNLDMEDLALRDQFLEAMVVPKSRINQITEVNSSSSNLMI